MNVGLEDEDPSDDMDVGLKDEPEEYEVSEDESGIDDFIEKFDEELEDEEYDDNWLHRRTRVPNNGAVNQLRPQAYKEVTGRPVELYNVLS